MNLRKINSLCSVLLGVSIWVGTAFVAVAQKPNWQNLDLKADSTFGISTEKAYQELLKGKKAKPVIVAVLDGGVDIKHEDLKTQMWVNKKEIAGNGKDDDKNGYIDDVNGWSFLGSAKGSVNHENLELTRLVRRDAAKFGNIQESAVKKSDLTAFQDYQKNKAELERQIAEAKENLERFAVVKDVIDGMVKKIGKKNPTAEDFKAYTVTSGLEQNIQRVMVEQVPKSNFEDFYNTQILPGYDHFKDQLAYDLNLDYNPRAIVGDNPDNSKERFYGTNDVTGPDALHGSHVAGIIAANRTNDLGIKGVADHVLIMAVRSTPNGDERDKDVANSIRYAVDNGAKVLNMSFGKAYTWDKAVVDEAVKYAVSKDVLLIHAAGNENKNLDVEKNYPNPDYLSGGKATAWITVGASGWQNDENLKADFSNYGKTAVDVFAPGVDIKSTVPGSKYQLESGTSMASPVVAGLAGLIRSYYPKLTAVQVKEIILKSVVKVNQVVKVKQGEAVNDVAFADLCVTGGVVNAYNALKLAETYK